MAKLLVIAVVAMVVAAEQAADSPYYEALSQDRADNYNGNYNDPMDGVGGSYNIKRMGFGNRRRQNQQFQEESYSPSSSYNSRQSSSERAATNNKQRPTSTNARYNSKPNYEEVYPADSYETKKESESVYDRSYEQSASSNPAPYYINRRNGGYGSSVNPFALLVAPLAGISFLAAAAALAISPAYLTITTTSLTGRKKRELSSTIDPELADKITPELMQKIEELQTLEKFLSTIPKDKDYQQQIMSMYLSCSGYTEDSNVCLDRVFCEYGNPSSEISEEERDVLAIILYNIMGNNFVKESFKNRLKAAARNGRDTKQCTRYNCAALATSNNKVF